MDLLSLALIMRIECNSIKKRLQHRCFPVKFAKFLITAFFTKHLRWLLLDQMRKKTTKLNFSKQKTVLKILSKLIWNYLCQIIFFCEVSRSYWKWERAVTIGKFGKFQENLVPKWNIFSKLWNLTTEQVKLIINMVFEVADLDPKLKSWAYLVSKLQCAQFLWNLALRTNRTC